MSLFDTLYIDKYPFSKFKKIAGLSKVFDKIPAAALHKADYQTKDLGQTYNGHFYLKKKADGLQLYHHSINYKWEQPDPEDSDSDDLFARLGHMTEESADEIPDDRTQTIEAYAYTSLDDERIWVEFSLEFVRGVLKDISLRELRIDTITEAEKAQDLKWQEELRKSNDYRKTSIGKVHTKAARLYYHSFAFKTIRGAGSLITKIGYAIQNWRPL